MCARRRPLRSERRLLCALLRRLFWALYAGERRLRANQRSLRRRRCLLLWPVPRGLLRSALQARQRALHNRERVLLWQLQGGGLRRIQSLIRPSTLSGYSCSLIRDNQTVIQLSS